MRHIRSQLRCIQVGSIERHDIIELTRLHKVNAQELGPHKRINANVDILFIELARLVNAPRVQVGIAFESRRIRCNHSQCRGALCIRHIGIIQVCEFCQRILIRLEIENGHALLRAHRGRHLEGCQHAFGFANPELHGCVARRNNGKLRRRIGRICIECQSCGILLVAKVANLDDGLVSETRQAVEGSTARSDSGPDLKGRHAHALGRQSQLHNDIDRSLHRDDVFGSTAIGDLVEKGIDRGAIRCIAR